MESQHGKKATSYVVRAEGDDKDNDEEVTDFVPDKEAIKILEGDVSLTTDGDGDEDGEDGLDEADGNQQHNSLINPQGDVAQEGNREEYFPEVLQPTTLPMTPKKRK